MLGRVAAGLLLAAGAGGTAPVHAQTEFGTVRGQVYLQDEPAPGTIVRLGGREMPAGAGGWFSFTDVPVGEHRIEAVLFDQYASEARVTVRAARTTSVRMRLEAPRLEPLSVTGTMRRRYVSDSPVKVEVMTGSELERSVASSLAEAVRHVNGLLPQVDCGVCYTNSIRINGMEGPYTAVLIDGMPIAGGLASVYGLSGIDPSLIEQLEIVRGPSSTLYGSEAMGGVVNVVTKDPRYAPLASVHASVADHGQAELDVAFAPALGRVRALLSGSAYRMQRFIDDNQDGFSDVTLDSRIALFGRSDWVEGGQTRGSLTAKVYHEDRFGGQAGWTRADAGGTRVYGESIRTRRAELIARLSPGWPAGLRLEGSWAWHAQDSYYGTTRYDARQHTGVANLLMRRDVGAHSLLIGATTRFHDYDDSTPATAEADRQLVPGLLVEDEFSPGPALVILAGMRVDRHAAHGAILSPRAGVKWLPFDHTTVRLSAGTGFRVVSVFTEDHAALTGAREVVFADALAPERSWSLAANLNQVVEIGPSPMMIDVDLFHTRFSNRIVPDYDTDPDRIIYANLRGRAVTRGVSLALNQNVAFDRLLYTIGATLQDVTIEQDGVRRSELFAPEWRVVFGLTFNAGHLPVTADWSGSVTGPMRLPSYPPPHQRPEHSPVHAVHDLKLTWRPGAGLAVYGAVLNVFDFRQGSPLVGAEDPFGDAFDTTYAWGPIEGRRLVVGGRWGLSR